MGWIDVHGVTCLQSFLKMWFEVRRSLWGFGCRLDSCLHVSVLKGIAESHRGLLSCEFGQEVLGRCYRFCFSKILSRGLQLFFKVGALFLARFADVVLQFGDFLF